MRINLKEKFTRETYSGRNDIRMNTFNEFLLTVKGNEYVIAVLFMILFVLFWKFLNTKKIM